MMWFYRILIISSVLAIFIPAYAEDKLVHLRPFAEGVDYAFLQPDGWKAVQGTPPVTLSTNPKFLIVAVIQSPDGAITGEIKFVAKDTSDVGKDLSNHVQQFFIDYTEQVLRGRLTKKLTIKGDDHVGLYRMQYVNDKNDTIIEQVINGGVGAISMILDIPPDHPLGSTALKILNTQKCDISNK